MEYTRQAISPSLRSDSTDRANRLGQSGLKVSKIIMGCMVFGSSKWEGSPWTLDEEEGLELLKKAYDMGINTWVGVIYSQLLGYYRMT